MGTESRPMAIAERIEVDIGSFLSIYSLTPSGICGRSYLDYARALLHVIWGFSKFFKRSLKGTESRPMALGRRIEVDIGSFRVSSGRPFSILVSSSGYMWQELFGLRPGTFTRNLVIFEILRKFTYGHRVAPDGVWEAYRS